MGFVTDGTGVAKSFYCHEKLRVSLELLNLFCKISEKYLNIYCIFNIFILGERKKHIAIHNLNIKKSC